MIALPGLFITIDYADKKQKQEEIIQDQNKQNNNKVIFTAGRICAECEALEKFRPEIYKTMKETCDMYKDYETWRLNFVDGNLGDIK